MGPDPDVQLSLGLLYCVQGKAGPRTRCGFPASEGSVPCLVSLRGCWPGLGRRCTAGEVAALVTLTGAPRQPPFHTRFTAVLLRLGAPPLE